MLEHFGKEKFHDDPRIENLIEALADWQVIPKLGTPRVRNMLLSVMKKSKYPLRLKALEKIICNDLDFSFYNKVEVAKIELSSQGASLVKMEENDIDIWELLTRYQFERDIAEYHSQIEKCLLDTIIESGLEPEEIDVAIKTGGSSNIPYFTGMLESIFGPGRVKASNTVSSVTAGLAIRAYEGDTRYRDLHTR